MHLYVWIVLIVGFVGLGLCGCGFSIVALGPDQNRMNPCDVT